MVWEDGGREAPSYPIGGLDARAALQYNPSERASML